MTTALAVFALLLKAAGFVFLLGAAIGLMRFADPLQRMHAATKAGTIGAGLIVGGAALASGDGLTMGVAAFTILFLVLTVPIAGHLLGRAIYVSRPAESLGLSGRDALAEVLRQGSGKAAENTAATPASTTAHLTPTDAADPAAPPSPGKSTDVPF